jgi:hypothetical protein
VGVAGRGAREEWWEEDAEPGEAADPSLVPAVALVVSTWRWRWRRGGGGCGCGLEEEAVDMLVRVRAAGEVGVATLGVGVGGVVGIGHRRGGEERAAELFPAPLVFAARIVGCGY